MTESKKMQTRKTVHISMAVVFMICVMVFKWIDNKSIINVILKVAGYTYGPLLGLFAFGILTHKKLNEKMVPVICLASPIICFLLDKYQTVWLGKFHIGIELLLINGLLTFLGLLMISKKQG